MAEVLAETFEAASVRARKSALGVLRTQLDVLRGTAVMTTSDTADLLRDVCEELNEMATDLTQTWKRTHPGQPQPPLPVEIIPAEELDKIGWDSHANRVRMNKNDNCTLFSFWSLLSGDQSGMFAKPPSTGQVLTALSAVEARLAGLDTADCTE
eukprot:TRINITY_DN3728_c0_g1_i1.p1 TRINITY_DN3728_c0_g1~~TRINITY_DN3728_c0_g1_i1.p1  ORF type:complete len:154 (-),score=40.99 TRINITY_DN3728_c0_g1_i1:64-525(-)